MAIPTYDQIMPPLLQLLAARGDLEMAEAIRLMADHFGLSQDERAKTVPNGVETYIYNRTYWASTHLRKQGFLGRPQRGVIRITESGRRFLAQNPAPPSSGGESPLAEALEALAEVENASCEAPEAETPRQTPSDMINAAEEALSQDLRAQLQEQLQKISPMFFERLIIDLMRAMGYGFDEESGRRIGGSGDGGIDGEIYEDKLGLDRILLQAKRYAPGSSIGSPQIREFIGSLDVQGVSKGVFVTTSFFTESAQKTIRAGGKRIILIDGARLADLMIEHGVGVRVEREVRIKALDLNYFEDA